MPAPNIVASTRYARFGVTRVVYALTISNYQSPTRAEINAGQDLSTEVAEISGFVLTQGFIETPDLATSYTAQILGRRSAEESSITMYASVNSVDVRGILPRGTTGFLLWFDEGDVPGRKYDVYPITVGSVGKERTTDDTAARLVVNVAVTREPAENITVPA
jgi:hypothetical protein